MSNSRISYLEIDSSFRDRNLWPLPGNFEIPISQTGNKNAINASDPVCDSSIKCAKWQMNRFTKGVSDDSIAVTAKYSLGFGFASDQTIIEILGTAGELQEAENYYSGAVVTTATPETRRIVSYKYYGGDRGQITISSPFSTAVVEGDTLTFLDPTDLSNVNVPLIFIPSGKVGTNAYNNLILYNEDLDEYREITSYDFSTHLVTLNVNTSRTSTSSQGPISSWTVNNTLSIRQNPPQTKLTLEGISSITSYTSFNVSNTKYFSNLEGTFLEKANPLVVTGTLTAGSSTSVTFGAGSSFNGFYNGATIRMITGAAAGESCLISGYTGSTLIATLSPGFVASPAAPDTYEITMPTEARRIVKYVDYRDTCTAGTLNSITFPASASKLIGYYTNLYIKITSGAASGDVRLINNYTPNVASVSTPFSALIVPGTTFTITSGVVAPSFTSSLGQDVVYLLPFTRDNLCPFVYNGSTVSQQESVCYEIELVNLILPNKTLDCGQGSRIAFYPYVYVELTNVSGPSSGMINSIYSNNPNSCRMVFRAAISDVQNPIISAFVKVSGGGMTQTLKFKPNDNLKFSVHLSNGEIYKTVEEEFYSPRYPNTEIQISALFSLQRL